MNEKKTAAQVHHHPNGEENQLAMPGFELPNTKSTTAKPEEQGPISSLLPYGAERAVSLRRLADMAGLSTREVRRAIQKERLNGVPICEAGAGYFIAGNDEERRRWVISMRGRARQILKAARAVERVGGADG